MVDDLARAYAILGLRQGSSLADVRRRYRFLAQRWHPDRHVGDTRSQTEATEAIRRISDAYQTLAAHLDSSSKAAKPGPARTPDQRLSRDAVDSIVKAIGSEGPLDWLLSTLGWVGGTLEGVASVLFAIACVIRLALLLWRRDLAAIIQDRALLIFLGILLLFLVHELLVRRRVIRSPATSLSGVEDVPPTTD